MESIEGAPIRPPDPGEQIKAVVFALFDSIETQSLVLKKKADQINEVNLQLLCAESAYIWREIHHLLRQDPSRLMRVWNRIEEYREVLLDIHIAVDRSPSFSSRDIDNFRDILRNILSGLRNGGIARNHMRSGTNFSIIQGARDINMTGGQYAINHYNAGPELVHFHALLATVTSLLTLRGLKPFSSALSLSQSD